MGEGECRSFRRRRFRQSLADAARAQIIPSSDAVVASASASSGKEEQAVARSAKSASAAHSLGRLQHIKAFFDAVRKHPLSEEPAPAPAQKGKSPSSSDQPSTKPVQPRSALQSLNPNIGTHPKQSTACSGLESCPDTMLMPELPPLEESEGEDEAAEKCTSYAPSEPFDDSKRFEDLETENKHRHSLPRDRDARSDTGCTSEHPDDQEPRGTEHTRRSSVSRGRPSDLNQKRRSSLGLSNRVSLTLIPEDPQRHEQQRARQFCRSSSLLHEPRSFSALPSYTAIQKSTFTEYGNLQNDRSTLDYANESAALPEGVSPAEAILAEDPQEETENEEDEEPIAQHVTDRRKQSEHERTHFDTGKDSCESSAAELHNNRSGAHESVGRDAVEIEQEPYSFEANQESTNPVDKSAHWVSFKTSPEKDFYATPTSRAERAQSPDGLKALMAECGQESKPLDPMDQLLSEFGARDYKKIGEGTFGEAFLADDLVLKVVPIDGETLYNGAKQKTAEEMHAEAIISNCLSDLREGDGFGNATSGFIEVKRSAVCKGPYALSLVSAWEAYAEKSESLNDHPNDLPENNHYLVFVCANGGKDLQEASIKSVDAGISVLLQIALTLAIAERSFEFEHRDLHWGNVLLGDEDDELDFKLDGCTYHVRTHGVRTQLIDFTLSRLRANGQRIYCNLAEEEEMFNGEKGYAQSETYRKMRNALDNDWSQFEPRTNAIWLSYIVRKVIQKVNMASGSRKRRALERFASRCSSKHMSAHDAMNDPLFEGYYSVDLS
jgi:serine/threonine-protein kinase haspin